MRHFLLFAAALCVFFSSSDLHAEGIPPGQDVGATTRVEKREKEKKEIEEKLAKAKEKVKVEGEEELEPSKPAELKEEGPKVSVRAIVVEGVSRIRSKEIRKIVSKYEGRELSLSDFQAAAEEITDEYRAKGYVTSFAYLPPQKVENETLRIAVVEGRVGKVEISGNKWFGAKLLMRYVDLNRGDYFNYDVLRRNIMKMNQRPDVNGRVVLSRGEEPGETDVDIQVKDHLPWHFTFGYNNYNSRFLERNKYSMELKSTNLLGLGDIASGEVQLGEADRYQLYSARYLFPIWIPDLYAGVAYIHVDQALGRSLGDLRITGDGDVITSFLTYKLLSKENFSLNVSPGFDWKRFENRLNGVETATDNVRVFKAGFDINMTDPLRGRNVLTHEFDFGVPDFLGGMDKKEDGASRLGAAGQFFKTVTNFARIQPLPFQTALLVKGVMQLSNKSLPASEQYQIGGYYTVRGYPVSEEAGDSGYSASAEYHIPPYFVPKYLKIPFTNQSLYETITFLGFVDWGYVTNNSPRAGEKRDDGLISTGFGVRFNVTDRASVSFDYGFPLSDTASDGASGAPYIEVKLFV